MRKCILPTFENITHSVKNKLFQTEKDSRLRRMALYYSKKLPALLKGITSKHNNDEYCLNCLHLFSTENKLKSYMKVC